MSKEQIDEKKRNPKTMKDRNNIFEETGKSRDVLDSILGSGAMRSNSFEVPADYFSSLRSRLGAIPSSVNPSEVPVEVPVPVFDEEVVSSSKKLSFWDRVKPYVAVAAAFLVMVTAGNALLRSSVSSSEPFSTERGFDYVVQNTNPYYLMMQQDKYLQEDGDSLSDDEIQEYLISSGLSVEHLSYLASYEIR